MVKVRSPKKTAMYIHQPHYYLKSVKIKENEAPGMQFNEIL